MDALLFIGGSGPGRDLVARIMTDDALVAAADSGFDLCLSYGLIPSLVVGDMDSIQSRALLDEYREQGTVELVLCERDKDETDTEIGIRLLREKGVARITLIGGGGGRIDHLLALCSLFARRDGPEAWYTEKEVIRSVEGRVELDGKKGLTVSFFPITEEACVMTSTGLKWKLDGLVWNAGDFGISNVILSDPCSVTVKMGKLLMILEQATGEYG